MNNYKVSSFVKDKMHLKIIAKVPEKLLNVFWKRGIQIENISRENLYTITFVVSSEYFQEIKQICEDTGSKVSVIRVGNLLKLASNIKIYLTLLVGIGISFGLMVVLSFFIWKIDIKGDKHISPYEIRQVIKDIGISKGSLKFKIDTDYIEEQIVAKNKNVLWSKVRIQGSTLQVEVVESFKPPVIEIDNTLGNIVADKDGEIVRIYTQSGTALVKQGDIVKKGDVLIAGYQGKEGGIYEIAPIGDVIAKTFLEFEEIIALEGVKNVNTKNKINEYYIEIFGKKIYLKKYKNEFENFEKINNDGKFIKKNIYYEVNKQSYTLAPDNVKKDLIDYYTKYVNQNLKQTDVIVGVIVKDEIIDNKLNLKISFVIEEDIGMKVQKPQEEIINEGNDEVKS